MIADYIYLYSSGSFTFSIITLLRLDMNFESPSSSDQKPLHNPGL